MGYQIKVIGPRGQEKIVELRYDINKATVKQLKKQVSEELKIDVEFRMVFGTEPLEESSLLTDYGIRHMSTIHTLIMLPGGI